MTEIHFVDTMVRDGSLSLWALGVRTGAMLAIAEQMDRCGFESMEFFGFAGYIKYVKEHKENPWTWMGEGAKKFHRTRLLGKRSTCPAVRIPSDRIDFVIGV